MYTSSKRLDGTDSMWLKEKKNRKWVACGCTFQKPI